MADSLAIPESMEESELLGAMLDAELSLLGVDSALLSIEQALNPNAATAAIESSPTVLRCMVFMSNSLPGDPPLGQLVFQTSWFG